MAIPHKKKLAILGGGVGSITAAFEITSAPNWKDIYEDITIYQMGWRIGGKGASGRRGEEGKIEEHGLHIWLGFYNNAFAGMQRAYKELGRPPGTPLATWEDAFHKQTNNMLAQEFNGQWYPWIFIFPENDLVPGKGDPIPSLWVILKDMVDWMISHQKKTGMHLHKETYSNTDEHKNALKQLEDIVKNTEIDIKIGSMTLAEDLLKAIDDHQDNLSDDPTKHSADDHHILRTLLDDLIAWIRREMSELAKTDLEVHRFVILFDTAATVIKGLIDDGILSGKHKLDDLDDEDMREWLKRHGALDISVYSPFIKGFYDLVFGYRDGDPQTPDFAAGAGLRAFLRILFTYKGAIMWKMQAGMGDTVFTPYYEVLKRRGVKFKFFHKVNKLSLSDDKTSVKTIEIGRQATLKGDEYQPLVNVLNLDCWPSEPHYDQLVEGEELKMNAVNLESFYTDWKDVETITLEAGKDFDEIIYGMSLATIPFLCQELIDANADWKAMVENVRTVRTMSFQTWMNKDLAELGWTNGDAPVMDAYIDPMNTWSDMSQLIDKENWAPEKNVKNISYFCGPMKGDIPPPKDRFTPEIAETTVKDASDAHLEKGMLVWWKDDREKISDTFDWNSVVDIFYRANIDPTERYVMTVKGSNKYRLRGDKSGFSNLYLVGDWTWNILNAGCVEAGTISGMIVSSALIGVPGLENIEGYNLF